MLPQDFIGILEALGRAFIRYREATGFDPVLVGGAASAINTDGAFMTGDFDVVASNDEALKVALLESGFIHEGGLGHLAGGFYHPDFPNYGVEQVSGPLFDGKTDRARLITVSITPQASIVLPPVEDLIADRLAQYGAGPASEQEMLLQAQEMRRLARSLDLEYLHKRIREEGGDPDLLDGTDRRQGKEQK